MKNGVWIPAQVYFEYLKNKSKVSEKPILSYERLLTKQSKDGGYVNSIVDKTKMLQGQSLGEIKNQLKTLKEQTLGTDKHPYLSPDVYAEYESVLSVVENQLTDTQGIKEKLYGDYAEEILTREDFLNYNELYSKRIEEYDRKITELEAEQRNLQTAPNAYPFLDVYRKYRKLEEITRPMIVELIEKIEVYEGNRVEITFRFQDEIADLLEELHQKQMGQHEVSA